MTQNDNLIMLFILPVIASNQPSNALIIFFISFSYLT